MIIYASHIGMWYTGGLPYDDRALFTKDPKEAKYFRTEEEAMAWLMKNFWQVNLKHTVVEKAPGAPLSS